MNDCHDIHEDDLNLKNLIFFTILNHNTSKRYNAQIEFITCKHSKIHEKDNARTNYQNYTIIHSDNQRKIMDQILK